MLKNKSDNTNVDISGRLRMIQQLEAPSMVAPRSPADDAIEEAFPKLVDVNVHEGRMYVAGHEPHFRTVTLLKHVAAPRQSEED